MKIEQSNANIFKYSFDIVIESTVERVWNVMFNNIDEWWMSDFRALGKDSTISLEPNTGAVLLEKKENGESLEWYRVQMCVPGNSIYLVGYLAPDWGGPTTSMLKLALRKEGNTTILTVSDALLGNVSENAAKNAQNGWLDMFTKGLKAFSEKSLIG